MGEINETKSNPKYLDYNDHDVYCYSVQKWKYDVLPDTSSSVCAQYINDNYFDESQYPHNIEIRWYLEAYTWNMRQLASSTNEIEFYEDLSDRITDVSVDIDSTSNIRQSANVTLLVKPTDDYWFMRRPNDWRLAGWQGINESVGVGWQEQSNPMWIPVVYKLYQKIIFPDDVPHNREVASTKNWIFRDGNWINSDYNPFSSEKISEVRTDTDGAGKKYRTREFGFFLPQSQGYTYDTTTHSLSLSLQGLSYGLTKEGGNVLIPPIATFSYWYNMPYNNSPTRKEAYDIATETNVYSTINKYITTNRQATDGSYRVTSKTDIDSKVLGKITAALNPKKKTEADKELEWLKSEEYKFIDRFLPYKEEHPSLQFSGTAQVLYEKQKSHVSFNTSYTEVEACWAIYDKTQLDENGNPKFLYNVRQEPKDLPTDKYEIKPNGIAIRKPKTVEIEVDAKRYAVPMALSFSGEEQEIHYLAEEGAGADKLSDFNKTFGYYKRYTTDEMTSILYDLATNRTDAVLNAYHLPLNGYNLCFDESDFTAKSEYFPNGFEFDAGVSVMDIAEKFIESKFYDGRVWIDEDRRFNFTSTPSIRSYHRGYLPYRYYSQLIQSEDISYDDGSYYNVTEVYGKDSEYYGVYNGSGGDGSINFKTELDNSATAAEGILHDMQLVRYSADPKIQVIQDDSIESDEECFNRAAYETWKSTRGQLTINLKIVDNFILGTTKMSHLCGNTFVEYKTKQGNGKTIMCILEKASLSGNIWSWTLKPFDSFTRCYDWYNYTEYLRIITKTYDEYIMVHGRHEWFNLFPDDKYADETKYVSEYAKNRLSQPVILGWELLEDNRLRLYISAIDIGYGIVKIFQGGGGAYNYGWHTKDSVDTNGTGQLPYGTPIATSVEELDNSHIYKIWETDKPLTQTGMYSFQAQLFSPYHEDSPSSEPVDIVIDTLNPTEQYVVIRRKQEDGTLKPDVEKEISHNWLMDEFRNIITDENGNKITV